MKFLVIVVMLLALATASAELLQERNIVVPVVANVGRISHGNTAYIGQFPYQVGLLLRIDIFSIMWCGGSLIGNKWVLTAAHCTDNIYSAYVYLGATQRTSAELIYTVTKNNIIIHSGWKSKVMKNDISLIKIPAVAYSNRIQPIKLPAIVNSYSTYEGDNAFVSGWGHTSDLDSDVTNNLQWARLQVVNNSVCAEIYGNSILTASNICVATTGGVSACKGDSGGPLVLESSGIQIGLCSYGAADGCTIGYPTVFTRLTHYLDWIKANTGISY